MNANFFECHDVALGFRPVNLATADNNGSWINMAGFEGVAVLFVKAVGTAGDDPTFTLQQATDSSGTGAKDLDFTKVYTKTGTGTSVTGSYTVVDQSAGNTYTNGTLAENAGLVGVWISVAEDMDIGGGFEYIRVQVPDVGSNAQLGTALYIGTGAKYKGAELPYL